MKAGREQFRLLSGLAKWFSPAVLGAFINAAGILIGGVIGLSRSTGFSPQTESFFRLLLGLFTVFHGLRLAWLGLGAGFTQFVKQFAIALLAVMLGKLLGRLLQLQHTSNRCGQYARKLIESAPGNDASRFGNGLVACSILFCASPLGIIGAIHSVLPAEPGGGGYLYPLIIKAVMDGLATVGFVKLFGSGAMISALPVFVFLSLLSLGCAVYVEPLLRLHGLTDSVNATGGLLLCAMSLVILELRRVELADFLPALAVAPLLTWLWK